MNTIIGNKVFTGGIHIMGILNVTPDSFSDSCVLLDDALFRVEQMIVDGAEIVDVGGESTRPGASAVSADIELERVLPVVKAIVERFDIPVSIDTYKPEVAKECLKIGASMVNDINGFSPEMAELCVEFGASCCLMQNGRLRPVTTIADVKREIASLVKLAYDSGISNEHIVVDGGVGFGKSHTLNLQIIDEGGALSDLPVLLACSRKSVIGEVLEMPVSSRLFGTLATTAAAVFSGCRFVRVHDVAENSQVIKMCQHIIESRFA